MVHYMTSPQLKQSAKARLTPIFSTVIGATAVYFGFTIVLNLSVSVLSVVMDSFWGILLGTLLRFIVSTLISVLGIGYRYLFLKLYCGRPIHAADTFFAFQNQLSKGVALSAVLSAVSALSMAPFTFFSAQYADSLNNMDIAAAFFCLTPAVLLVTLVGLVYSQIYYLMLDFPSYTVKELFKRSRLLMRGHKGRLFYIIVSFIPWYLFGCITCGIGLFWSVPYMQAVMTEFYLDLVTKKQEAGGHPAPPLP